MCITRRLTVAALAALLSACGDTTNPLAGRGQQISLSFSGRAPGAATQSVPGDSMVLTDGTNTLVVTDVEIVIRKIELKRAGVSVNCDSTANEDDCEEFTIGALLVDLPLGSGAQSALSVPVDSGTYSKVEFKIHKPGNDSVDVAFRAAHPTWPSNVSIRVTGRYNGTAFTFTTPLDAEQEYTFSPPLVVDASGGATNLTIRLDVSTWFRNGTGGPLVDPATANLGGANESLVKDNIKNSIKAFHDHNRNGNENDG